MALSRSDWSSAPLLISAWGLPWGEETLQLLLPPLLPWHWLLAEGSGTPAQAATSLAAAAAGPERNCKPSPRLQRGVRINLRVWCLSCFTSEWLIHNGWHPIKDGGRWEKPLLSSISFEAKKSYWPVTFSPAFGTA